MLSTCIQINEHDTSLFFLCVFFFYVTQQLLKHHVVPGAVQSSALQNNGVMQSLLKTPLRVKFYESEDNEWRPLKVRGEKTKKKQKKSRACCVFHFSVVSLLLRAKQLAWARPLRDECRISLLRVYRTRVLLCFSYTIYIAHSHLYNDERSYKPYTPIKERTHGRQRQTFTPSLYTLTLFGNEERKRTRRLKRKCRQGKKNIKKRRTKIK